MNALRFLALLGLAVVAPARAGAEERGGGALPAVPQQAGAQGGVESRRHIGPFLFKLTDVDGGTVSGFRPFWVQTRDSRGDFRAGHFLYPLFSYTADADTYRWSFVELIRRTDRRAGASAPKSVYEPRGEFEVWPFWFSRETGNPEMSYRALFPIAGTIKNKLFFERLSWTLFPFYAESEKRGTVTTFTPWPIVRVTRGAAHGFGLWPLYTWQERPGVTREEYYLWPLGYNRTVQSSADAGAGTPPRHDLGALPFYARSTGPGYLDESYAWPFFGYTDRTVPFRYRETRYLWPFLVQGRGDDRYLNRWGPFYTRSIVKGYDKTWYAWPLVRRAQWTDAGLVQTKTQFFYFLYWSNVQRSAARPNLPTAGLRHVWPLFSSWDNGAGRRQLQVLSPFEVFFPGNEKVRLAWTPFFSLLRYDQQAPGEIRAALLWNVITWQRSTKEARSEFHLGPLLSVQSNAQAKRIALGNGLIAWQREPTGAGWRLFWLDFPGRSELRFPSGHRSYATQPTNCP